jgi:thiosulfate/3-mercaptopyruvate sulfurtransferase
VIRKTCRLVLALLLAVSAVSAQSRDTSVPLLVSSSWLGEHLQDRDVVILWTDQGNHDEALIPGARAVPHESLMTMQGGHSLAPGADLVRVLRAAGVSNDSHVVVYGDPLSAGWLFFALDSLGHQRVSLLDGGLPKWRSENRPIARTPTVPAPGTFTPSPRSQVVVAADDVQTWMKSGAVALDARSPREFEAGHIPGAKLLPWQDMFADPRQQVFKTREAMLEMFRAAGVTPGARLVVYCQIGMRSSALYFAARYAGLDVSNYVGSWSDWTARHLPVEGAVAK